MALTFDRRSKSAADDLAAMLVLNLGLFFRESEIIG